MEPRSTITFLILAFLIILSAYLSATETAFTTLRPALLKARGEKNQKRVTLVLRLHENFDKLLSTILTINTIVYLVAASVATVLFIGLFGEAIGPTLSVVILTVVTLIFAEVTPKSMAKESPEKVALLTAPLLSFLIFLCTPFNFAFVKWRRLLKRIFKNTLEERLITDDELMSMVEEMEQEGEIDQEDMELIHNAIEFKDRVAQDILTPRVAIEGIEKGASPDEVTELFLTTGFSRIPVYEESLDNIIGIVHLRDFFSHVIKKGASIDSITKEPVFVAPTMEISQLVKELQRKKSHIAVVADEYGGTAGIVTMEDILEELVGEIWDESDDVVEEFVAVSENKYRVLCGAYIDRFFEFFDLEDEDEDVDASTVNGWIMDKLGKIPEIGDAFIYKNLNITVHTTENRKVLDCIVEIVPEERPDKNGEKANEQL